MTVTEKLIRLTADRGKSQVAGAAGLPKSAISNYIAKKQMPRGDNALALARALNVPLEWLVDNEQDWPPPQVGAPTPAQLSDEDLMNEVARRYRIRLIEARGSLHRLKGVKWDEIAESLFQTPVEQPLPEKTQAALNNLLFFTGTLYYAGATYDPRVHANEHHANMPGNTEPLGTLDLSTIREEWERWSQENELVGLVQLYWTWLQTNRRGHGQADGAGPVQRFLKEIRSGMYAPEAVAKAKAMLVPARKRRSS